MGEPAVVYNQELRRVSNEGRRHAFGTSGREIAFICECDRDSCLETVLLTAEEYDAVRPGPILTPGHAKGEQP